MFLTNRQLALALAVLSQQYNQGSVQSRANSYLRWLDQGDERK